MVRQHGPRRGPAGRGRPTPRSGVQDEGAALPAIVVGLGEVGRLVAAAAARHPDLKLVGAADPAHRGGSLRELVPGAPDLRIAADAASAYRAAAGGVALVCTGSRLDEVAGEIERAVRAGLHVVSSCEELAAAGFVDPELAETIDAWARRSGVSVLGTGVNPGFVLDRLSATLGAVVGEVRRVVGLRVVELSSRRPALAKKAGVGLAREDFERLADDGAVGHVGLSESAALIADGLGLDVDEIEEEIDPIVAERTLELGGMRVEAGRVRGLRQVAQAFDEGREVVRLTLELLVGADEPRDELRLEGEPSIELKIPGGVPGDAATAWALVNAAPRVASSEPGLLTVLDLPAGR